MRTTGNKQSAPNSTPNMANGQATEVFTLPEAAAYLRLKEDEVVQLVHSQALPGRFTGHEWRFLRSAIQQWLSSTLPTTQARKQAQLALAGKYQDDPDLMRICAEAYRQRGRPLSQGE